MIFLNNGRSRHFYHVLIISFFLLFLDLIISVKSLLDIIISVKLFLDIIISVKLFLDIMYKIVAFCRWIYYFREDDSIDIEEIR